VTHIASTCDCVFQESDYDSVRSSAATLELSSVSQTDSGRWACVASNQITSISHYFNITVHGKTLQSDLSCISLIDWDNE